jgi:hypothetical protein
MTIETENRLIGEKSPYLLQHAHNPVDWWPWGPEAFQRARREDKPIFLSIGYSTCHWCHVMERESFEDPDLARLLNEAFVPIKVDREERPDIDGVYMTVCQMMTGHGGWPLTILMAPDGKPFFAGTYIPKESRFGRMGLRELIAHIQNLWENHRDELLRSSEKVTAVLERLSEGVSGAGGEVPGEELLHQAYHELAEGFDERYGGFGGAPKFPIPHQLMYLLRYGKRTGEPRAIEMASQTLRAMRRGGIYDQIGFGFHRYSTDERWILPHFEKMLYDQALLALAHLEAYQATGLEDHARTAREAFEYVLRDLRAPEGGFCSAEDADSEGEEGKFYVWTLEEIQELLSPPDAELAIWAFGVRPEGNYVEEATGRPTGQNVLHLEKTPSELADELSVSEYEVRERLEWVRRALFEARERRVRPLKDEKILTDWNGLMIAALARGAQVLDEPQYAEAATSAADFLLSTLRDERGRLFHRYRDGEAAVAGFLDDYAFLIWGLIELYEAVFEPRYLRAALELNEVLLEDFWDDERGGFYFTADDAETVLTRRKQVYDGAVPSGNAVAMLNLLRLERVTARPDLEEKAARIAEAFSALIAASPTSHTQLLLALDFALGPSQEIVIAGDPESSDTRALLRALQSSFAPNRVVLFRPTEPEALTEIVEIAPFLRRMEAFSDRATAYVCQNYQCDLPTSDPEELREYLRG